MAVEMSRSEYWMSTTAAEASDQYDAWLEKLTDLFGIWRPRAQRHASFRAEVKRRSLPNLSLIECRCQPFACTRSKTEARRAPAETLTIQLVGAGREWIASGAQEALLRPGDIFIWDNTQPMSFEVLEPLHKLCIVIPRRRVKDWLREEWSTRPRWLRREEPGTAILRSFLHGLARIDDKIGGMRLNALIEAAVAMLVAQLPEKATSMCDSAVRLESVKTKIREEFADPDLDLERIARANHMSVRLLHRLFERDGSTPWRFVTRLRLEACYRDLVNPALRGRNITDIALAWGFSNVAHFSRKMKSEYGVSPSELRARAFDRRMR